MNLNATLNDTVNTLSTTLNATPFEALIGRTTLDDLDDEIDEWEIDLDWVVEGFFPSGTAGYIYGPSMDGKTFAVTDICCSVAAGLPQWAGRDIDVDGQVLIFSGEGKKNLRKRIRGWEQEKSRQMGELISTSNNIKISSKTFCMTDEANANGIINLVKAHNEGGKKIVLIVFDTVKKYMHKDENSSTEMGKYLVNCESIAKETGAAVISIHHTGKDGTKGMRGSSSIVSDAEFVFKTSKEEHVAHFSGEVPEVLFTTTLTCEKQKDGNKPDPLGIALKSQEVRIDNKGRPVTTLVPARYESGKKIQSTPVSKKEYLAYRYASVLTMGEQYTSQDLKDLNLWEPFGGGNSAKTLRAEVKKLLGTAFAWKGNNAGDFTVVGPYIHNIKDDNESVVEWNKTIGVPNAVD